jgi:hypothetical protein
MVTPELIERLKQVNVSKDKDKTAERVKSVFGSATRKQKAAIEKLSGQKRTSIYRVFKTGSLNAKILLPIAKTLNISPLYLTGESDDIGKCSDAQILSFLDAHGYKNLSVLEAKPARGRKRAEAEAVAEVPADKPADKPARGRKPAVKPAGNTADEGEDTITVSITLSNSPKMRGAVEKLDAENAAQLLSALCLRAKAGGNAEQLWDVVKLCLLS